MALHILPSPQKFQRTSQLLFPGTGEFAVCETCRLGRGKCRKVCLDSEKIAGKCKLNFFCCRERIWAHWPCSLGLRSALSGCPRRVLWLDWTTVSSSQVPSLLTFVPVLHFNFKMIKSQKNNECLHSLLYISRILVSYKSALQNFLIWLRINSEIDFIILICVWRNWDAGRLLPRGS